MTTGQALPSRRKLLRLGLAVGALVFGGAAAYKLVPRFYNAQRLRELEGRRVYDENANAEAEISRALERAKRETKRVLVIFGGNWCKWCLALDDLLKTDAEIQSLIRERFVLLKLDGDAGAELDQRWGRPTRLGVPVLVFLNPDGKVAHIQSTVELETWGGRILSHDRERVLEVLGKWARI